MKPVFWAAALAMVTTAAPAVAQKEAKSTKGPASDHAFVKKAGAGGLAEVELGKLAAERASSDEVKRFGRRMVDDHSKANDELNGIARDRNVALPTGLDSKDKALKARLSKLSGDAFDRAYMRAMVDDHRKDVSEFRTEATSGKDPEIKAWASKTLPTLEDHLKVAENTNRVVGTAGSRK
jgi:putative membrane protein